MPNTITHNDLISVSRGIDTNSINCIICDPPYNIGKDFGNESDKQSINKYTEWVDQWLPQIERILKPSGTGFIYGFDEILANISVKLSLSHRWLIWYYTNKNTAQANFWQRSHESIIVFWKDSKQRIFNADEVREPYTETFVKNFAGKTRAATSGRLSKKGVSTIYNVHELGAMGRDVIKVPALAGGSGSQERIFFCETCNDVFMGNKKQHREHSLIEHPTQKPQALTEKLLKSCLPYKNGKFEGEVYIPFSGSGSESLCCKRLGVNSLSSDINPDYVKYGNLLLIKY